MNTEFRVELEFLFIPSFIEHVILLTLFSHSFQVKSRPLLCDVVVYSAYRLLGGSCYFVVSTGLVLIICYSFILFYYIPVDQHYITMSLCPDIAV